MGWFTGALESEGSFQLATGRCKKSVQLIPRVNIGNKSQSFIDRIQTISIKYGFPVYLYHYKGGMIYGTWYGMKRVKKILDFVKNYLADSRKKEIVDYILEFINSRFSNFPNSPYSEREKDIFFLIRKLNGKGRLSKQELKYRLNSLEESSTTIRQTSKDEDIVCSA